MKAHAPDNCDLCGDTLRRFNHFYDAATYGGPWGWLCKVCFLDHGVGIGIGRGQEYDSSNNEQTRGGRTTGG